MGGREGGIDSAKGLVCVLLVVWHVVGSGRTAGLQVPDDSAWRFFVDLFIYFRMPAFAFLSGYLYALSPVADRKLFLVAKIRLLLLPMLVVGTLFAVTQTFTPGTNLNITLGGRDWVLLHVIPVDHFWFIEAIFLIFAVIAFVDAFQFLRRGTTFIVVLATSIVVQLNTSAPIYFGLSGALYLFPYFLCGVGCCRFRVESSRLFVATIPIFILGYVYACAGLLGYASYSARISVVALIIGATGPWLLIHSGWKQSTMGYVGANCYAIFLFHPFFTAASRMLLYGINIKSTPVLLFVGTLVGVLGPILTAMLANRFAITRTALLGKKWVSNPKKLPMVKKYARQTVAAN